MSDDRQEIAHVILHVWVEDMYRMVYESIGPFPTRSEAYEFSEQHINQRSLECYGRLYEIFIVPTDGSTCTYTPDDYLADLEEMYGSDGTE